VRGNVAALPLSSVCVVAAAQQPPVAAGAVAAAAVADALLDERRELTGLPRLTRCLGHY
jgi:hypothetical protein